MLEAPTVVAGLDDVAVMGEAIEQGGGHLRITEHGGPFAECQVRRHDHRGLLVQTADHMEQQLPAGLGERQVAEFVEDDEVETCQMIGQAPLPASPAFGLEPVDQINGVEEPAARSTTNAAARDRDRQMRLARAGPADQHDVALLR